MRIGTPDVDCIEDFFRYWVFETKDQYDFIDRLGGIRFLDEARRQMEAAQATIDDSDISFDYQEVIPKRG